MSLNDDLAAEIEAKLDWARQKSRYGRKYSPAFELARRIKMIRRMLSDRPADAKSNRVEIKFMAETARILLRAATVTSKKLREIADALDTKETTDPRQKHILDAYEAAILNRYPPTLASVRKEFVRLFGNRLWPHDFSVRKTLQMFRLPLADDTVGRPPGSQSIRNR